MSQCPCLSGKDFDQCCGPILRGDQAAATAEALMRSRYSAFSQGETDYLTRSLHPDHRHDNDPAATKKWADESEWLKLEILATSSGGADDDEGTVDFIATYRMKGQTHAHHELGHFKRHKGIWYYTHGKLVSPGTVRHEEPKTGRNDPCPCGSGKKYKKCCG